MEGKQSQMGTETTICHKIRRALTIGFSKRMSYKQHQDDSPRFTTTSVPPHLNIAVQNKQGSRAIPIEYSHNILVQNGKKIIKQSHVEVEGKAKANAKVSTKFKATTSSESDNGMNERFTDYINRAKKTITKTSSDAGTGRITKLGSVNKKASAYINKTRQRFGSFRVESFKKREQM